MNSQVTLLRAEFFSAADKNQANATWDHIRGLIRPKRSEYLGVIAIGKGTHIGMHLYLRFLQKVVREENGCIAFKGNIVAGGYGQMHADSGGPLYAHRFSYQMFVGEIPHGLVIDHLCRNRHCVNPDHLRAVTHYENTIIGISPQAINSRKTACPQGHIYDDTNTYYWNGDRQCRICRKINFKNYKRRRHERIRSR